jgi:hypothetical protein
MGSNVSMEEQYKIAMIALAGASGALLISLIVTCCCCCRYKRKLKGGGHGVRFGKQATSNRKSILYEVSPYEAWGSSVQGRSCGCQGTTACNRCQNYATAYDWHSSARDMTPAVTIPNPYSMTPSMQVTQAPSPGFGRVLLNAPSALNGSGAVCTKPKLNVTPIGGNCGSGAGAACAYNMTSSQPTGNNLACSTAQFVLESSSSRNF